MPPPRRLTTKGPGTNRSDSPPTTSGPSQAEAGGILTIDLTAVANNYRALTRRVLPAECAAVVKADGYGCGIDHVTTTLVSAGCKTFFVAQLDEARRVRMHAPAATIYVLDGFPAGTGPAFAEIKAQPMINSAVELAEWDQFVAINGWRGGIGLNVDTGMNRLGLSLDEAAAIAPRIHAGNHGITLLMSHFACSEQPANPLNTQQIRLFREIRTLYRGIPATLANSSGIFLGPAAHCDLVRPGAALYGINPTPGAANPMQAVVELRARVLQIRSVEKGATVGYGATWTAERDTRVAIIAAGYADGYPRAAAQTESEPGRQVQVANKLCPIVGRVSMDLFAVDVTDSPQGAIQRGGFVTLIGGSLSADEVAAHAGTIGYELLTNLGSRYHRTWTNSAST